MRLEQARREAGVVEQAPEVVPRVREMRAGSVGDAPRVDRRRTRRRARTRGRRARSLGVAEPGTEPPPTRAILAAIVQVGGPCPQGALRVAVAASDRVETARRGAGTRRAEVDVRRRSRPTSCGHRRPRSTACSCARLPSDGPRSGETERCSSGAGVRAEPSGCVASSSSVLDLPARRAAVARNPTTSEFATLLSILDVTITELSRRPPTRDDRASRLEPPRQRRSDGSPPTHDRASTSRTGAFGSRSRTQRRSACPRRWCRTSSSASRAARIAHAGPDSA